MFKATHISKIINKKVILDSCDIKLQPGKFTAIVGPNGAGKSTLLKILAGEDKFYNGEVNLNGKLLTKYKTRELAKVRAIMPQHTMVNFPFTVEQVVEIGRYGHPNDAHNQSYIEDAIEMTGLQAMRNRSYQTLSGGEKQRVQMARVIAQISGKSLDPRYLLLDEPTSSLDLAQQHNLLSLAKRLCTDQIGVMAVLHDLNLALQYADEILFLKKGKTTAYGEISKVVNEEVIENTFEYPVRLLYEDAKIIVIPSSVPFYGAQKASNYNTNNNLINKIH